MLPSLTRGGQDAGGLGHWEHGHCFYSLSAQNLSIKTIPKTLAPEGGKTYAGTQP